VDREDETDILGPVYLLTCMKIDAWLVELRKTRHIGVKKPGRSEKPGRRSRRDEANDERNGTPTQRSPTARGSSYRAKALAYATRDDTGLLAVGCMEHQLS